MPKIIILYDTFTGNTETMSKAVAEGAKSVENVEVEVYKLGSRFPITALNDADGIILGSPTEYGNVTTAFRSFFESMTELKAAKKLTLNKKVGGAFGSYSWDGGWAVDMLATRIRKLGVKIVAPTVSEPEFLNMGKEIAERHLEKCRELGRVVAASIAKSKA